MLSLANHFQATWVRLTYFGQAAAARAAFDQCGQIRNAERKIHASGLDRGASNPQPNLDMPDQNFRNIGTYYKKWASSASSRAA